MLRTPLLGASSLLVLGSLSLVSCGDKNDTGPVDGDADTDADADTDTDSDTDADADTDADTDTGTGLSKDSSYCWTVDAVGSQLALLEVGLPSGDIRELGRYSVGTTSRMYTGGLAYDGSSLVMAVCNGNDFEWLRVDLATGAGSWGPSTRTASVTWDGTWFLVEYGSEMHAYPDWTAIISHAPKWSVSNYGYSRVGAGDGVLFGTYHSTDTVGVLDPSTGVHLRNLTLEGFDTWVWGIGYAGGYLHLLDDGREAPYQRIVRFDPDTGAHIDFISFAGTGWEPHGLWCSDEPTRPSSWVRGPTSPARLEPR
jgi:hypothetical protein